MSQLYTKCGMHISVVSIRDTCSMASQAQRSWEKGQLFVTGLRRTPALV